MDPYINEVISRVALTNFEQASSMRIPAEIFRKLMEICAPTVVLSLALQGIFRGFKDIKTPLFCLGVGNLVAVYFFSVAYVYIWSGCNWFIHCHCFISVCPFIFFIFHYKFLTLIVIVNSEPLPMLY